MNGAHEVLEGEIVPSSALARTSTTAVSQWVPQFAVSVDDMVALVAAKHDFYRRVMRAGDHYGTIPGAGTKTVLLKPGAELLLASMGLYVAVEDAEPPVRSYGDAEQEGCISYRRRARIYRQTGNEEFERVIVAQAEGFCTSRETKYRWRESRRKCPSCAAEAIIKGKEEYGGGWLCFKKQGGCGAKFAAGDATIEAQKIGRVPNPDLADAENTILKMADKRAIVAATLLATGCSDIFTQDIEDAELAEPAPHAAPPKEHDRDREKARIAADVPAVRARLDELMADPRLLPSDVQAAILNETGAIEIESIKTLSQARRVIAALEEVLVDIQNEVPF